MILASPVVTYVKVSSNQLADVIASCSTPCFGDHVNPEFSMCESLELYSSLYVCMYVYALLYTQKTIYKSTQKIKIISKDKEADLSLTSDSIFF